MLKNQIEIPSKPMSMGLSALALTLLPMPSQVSADVHYSGDWQRWFCKNALPPVALVELDSFMNDKASRDDQCEIVGEVYIQLANQRLWTILIQ